MLSNCILVMDKLCHQYMTRYSQKSNIWPRKNEAINARINQIVFVVQQNAVFSVNNIRQATKCNKFQQVHPYYQTKHIRTCAWQQFKHRVIKLLRLEKTLSIIEQISLCFSWLEVRSNRVQYFDSRMDYILKVLGGFFTER